jgi:hypothetical protein
VSIIDQTVKLSGKINVSELKQFRQCTRRNNKEEKTKEMAMRPHISGLPSLPGTPMKLTTTGGRTTM